MSRLISYSVSISVFNLLFPFSNAVRILNAIRSSFSFSGSHGTSSSISLTKAISSRSARMRSRRSRDDSCCWPFSARCTIHSMTSVVSYWLEAPRPALSLMGKVESFCHSLSDRSETPSMSASCFLLTIISAKHQKGRKSMANLFLERIRASTAPYDRNCPGSTFFTNAG